MKKLFLAACMALGLVACGGGGGSSTDAIGTAVGADALKAKPVVADPTLAAQPISMVNTTTAGDQTFRSIGALTDGGYTVAWISDNTTLFIQRYDSAGNKVGGETAVSLTITGSTDTTFTCPLICNSAGATSNASVAVLPDGSVVVSYGIASPAGQDSLGFPQFNLDIYLQRFDANGVQLAGETAVFTTLVSSTPRNHPFLTQPEVVPLADGGFVVAWGSGTGSDFGLFGSFGKQRYDSQAEPVGPIVTSPVFELSMRDAFRLAPDASGGYTLTIAAAGVCCNNLNNNFISITHYDAADIATQITVPGSATVLLLPLEGDRFVLFTSDASGSFRQFLDASGASVGDAIPIPTMPTDARELADGSFVVFWNASGILMFQRFDSAGAVMGNVQTIATHVGATGVAALADSGFALAWSGPSGNGDLDVFTTRFVEVLSPDQAALRAKRKACLNSAKGMTGQQRKAFMDACLAA